MYKKTETEEIQKKTSDPTHWHTHTHRHSWTQTQAQRSHHYFDDHLLRTEHHRQPLTRTSNAQLTLEECGTTRSPVAAAFAWLSLSETLSQLYLCESVCVSVCGCAESAECDRVRSRASCMAWLSLTRRQLGTAIVGSDLWINVKFLVHFVDSTNICKVLGFKQIKYVLNSKSSRHLQFMNRHLSVQLMHCYTSSPTESLIPGTIGSCALSLCSTFRHSCVLEQAGYRSTHW